MPSTCDTILSEQELNIHNELFAYRNLSAAVFSKFQDFISSICMEQQKPNHR